MARKVVVTLIDDYDGTSTAEETVTFAIDGITYEIDLSTTNATKLRQELDQWIPHARRTGRTTKAKPSTRKETTPDSKSSRRDLTAIRAWAAANGHKVSTRGRIAAETVAAYEKASA
ncbi:histone-like nucleoid-structuring protein Lsr2 [Nocardia thailandica]|uniref:histone-like nucleoid-structuring protein Lsr2 n=1 Tax=Nocardia thailandica TaxID=257275 RepID=UPI0003060D4D|nr:Lsr2 family protein [Nocardia thailandica]